MLRIWRTFFGRGEYGDFHGKDCYLVITIHLCFTTRCNTGDEVGVVSGLLFEFPANRNAMGLLVVAQQSWHKFSRNASHVQIVCQNALNGPYGSPTILQTSWIFRLRSTRINSRTFALFSGAVFVDGRRQTFVRPWSVCNINGFALAHGIISEGIRWVSAAVF
jgi:hypothetical protein